jgi:hypothetical protein
MRVLVVGFPLPNPQFDNYTLLNSPSWFDYDAVIVEPESVSTVIENVVNRKEEHETRAEEPILNRPTTPFAVALADMIRRRRGEAAQLLANGGVIAVFTRPNVVHEEVVGFPGCDRYAWLPAPAGVSWDSPFLVRAEGTEVHASDSLHPFARMVDRHRPWFFYRARIDENAPGFPTYGSVFARSYGGVAIGADLKVGEGRVILLPAFAPLAYGDQRFELASEFLEALRLCTRQQADTKPPAWVSELSLPGSEELEASEREATEALAAAEIRVAEAQASLTQLTKYRALIWQEGRFGLEPAVCDAFRAIGFEVESDPDKPGWIADGRVRAFYEVEASTEAVLEYPYFRLQKRLEKDLIDTKEPKHGLIVVNGQRLSPPVNRNAQLSETLRIAVDNYRYGLLTTERLFEIVKAVLADPHNAPLRSMIRSRLLNAVGEVSADVIPTVEELA